mmetsp:Transcript_6234/g.9848  ORF Transcript_6234/g.9848 Transcript_6234/m.9848 type:complete len:572 (+) Transcript_6234:160-1875(+)
MWLNSMNRLVFGRFLRASRVGVPIWPLKAGVSNGLGRKNGPVGTCLRGLGVRFMSDGKRLWSPTMLPETKWVETPFNARVFDMFKLMNFSKDELTLVFEKLDKNKNGVVERDEVEHYLETLYRKDDREMCISDEEVHRFCMEFMKRFENDPGQGITREQFDKVIMNMANTVDSRVWPITFSMVLAGVAIGIIIPVMPLFVKELGLSASEFGLVVSAFGLSKLLGNIPCAFLADKHGRVKVMTAGMSLLSVGMFGISFVTSLPELVGCRLVMGLGASAFTTASMLYLMDIGTPFSRTKTMAPISAGFSGGTAVGPAIGGFLAHYLGLQPTFMLVGSCFGLLMLLNTRLLTETLKPSQMKADKGGLWNELKDTTRQWRPLLANQNYRSVLGLNIMYWVALSGSYMTLLPMLLVREEMGLSPSQIGGVFAMTSAISMVCTQPAAVLADKFGRPQAMVASSAVVSAAMFSFPLMPELTPALVVLGAWAIGGTIFGIGTPTAYVADIVPAQNRTQALALLRTTGDIGLLFGASATGTLSDYTNETFAMQTNAGLLLGTGMLFGLSTAFQTRKAKSA